MGNEVDDEVAENRNGNISPRQFYRYHLFPRQESPSCSAAINALIYGERFYQQLYDIYACAYDSTIAWHRNNQDTICTDLYRGVIDALRTENQISTFGEPVILTPSYHGGDRHMTQCYQKAMAIVRALGKPSLFITFTANPHWPEIRTCLEHGQTPDTRPDLIAIVFRSKLDALLHDVKVYQIFGKCFWVVYTIECQKRGLPHAHILLFLQSDDVPRCAAEVDELVMAYIPDDDPALAEILMSLLTCGPCGNRFPNSPCMQTGTCSKGYPKMWCEQTVMTDGSYPEYARSNNGRIWGGERFTFDYRWVVPFNPFLKKKFAAHIDVEVAKGLHAVKYLAKYVYEGSDRATISVGDRYDEIALTLQGRYISPVQAV